MFPRLVYEFVKVKSYRNLTISAVLILFNGTLIYHFAEGWRWLDAFYFSAMTLTTVGYGDFTPQTDFGKLFTIVYVIIGIGIIFGFIDAFYKHRSANQSGHPAQKIHNRIKKKIDDSHR